MHLWRTEYDSFIRIAQLKFRRRLIVVPLSTFHRLAEAIGDPKGELIFLFNTARCGSTLLTEVHHWICLFIYYNDHHSNLTKKNKCSDIQNTTFIPDKELSIIEYATLFKSSYTYGSYKLLKRPFFGPSCRLTSAGFSTSMTDIQSINQSKYF